MPTDSVRGSVSFQGWIGATKGSDETGCSGAGEGVEIVAEAGTDSVFASSAESSETLIFVLSLVLFVDRCFGAKLELLGLGAVDLVLEVAVGFGTATGGSERTETVWVGFRFRQAPDE